MKTSEVQRRLRILRQEPGTIMFINLGTADLLCGGFVRTLKSRTNSAIEMVPWGAWQALGKAGVRGCGSCLPPLGECVEGHVPREALATDEGTALLW